MDMAIMQEDEDGISVPNWLLEVLAWINRIEMANSQLSFSCKLFKQLCFPKLHENVEAHKIKYLDFCGDSSINYLRINNYTKKLPIPKMLPPSYILGFNYIYIHLQFLGDQLLEFVQNILPRFNQINFSMALRFQGWMPYDKWTNVFRGLLNLLADKIVKFIFHDYSARVFEFNRLFPDFIQKVNFLCACPIPEEFDILFEWLALPPINGKKQQKILELKPSFANCTDKFIDRIKEEFSNANEPLNFFIIFPNALHLAYFSMENEKTGEILILYWAVGERNHDDFDLIVRCPKGEEDYWKEKGHGKMREYSNDEDGNAIFIQTQMV